MVVTELAGKNGARSVSMVERTMRPMENFLLVRKVDSRRESAILLPDSLESTLQEGLVLALGPGRALDFAGRPGVRVPIDVRLGDRILFSKRATVEVDPDDTGVVLIAEPSIIMAEKHDA